MDTIEKLEKEIIKVKIELTMDGYHSAWGIKAYKDKLVKLEDRLKKLKKIKND